MYSISISFASKSRPVRLALRAGLIGLLLSGLTGPALAGDPVAADPQQPAQESFADKVRVSFRNLTYWQSQWPQKPFLGADNPFNLPSDTLESDFRLDLAAKLPYLELLVKPRWELTWERWESGWKKGEEESDENAYINEWLVRLQPLDNLFLSYGREDLQWGPALLLSPSNPFYTSNGKSQPKKEVPGADYARLLWAPDQNWTASIIVNTDEGRKENYTEFAKTCALKIDYLAERGYASLNLAKKESADWRLSGFASWNLNEKIILYTEGSGTDDAIEALVGGSYTFADGGMINVEYFHNGSGDRTAGLQEILNEDFWRDGRMTMLRENYLLLQYHKEDVYGNWSTTLRWTAGLDDSSSSLFGLYEYNVSDHVQLFVNGTANHGNSDDELSATLDYQTMAGIDYKF